MTNETISSEFGNIQPWEDVILCGKPPEEKTKQGVILPGSEEAQHDPTKRPEKGIVVAVGPRSEEGKKYPIAIQPGDMIFYERYSGNPISDQGIQLNFIRLRFVVGVKKKIEVKK